VRETELPEYKAESSADATTSNKEATSGKPTSGDRESLSTKDELQAKGEAVTGKGRHTVNGKPPRVDRYFRAMCKHSASDLHFKADTPAKFRLKGDIRNIEGKPLHNDEIQTMMFEIMDERQQGMYRELGSVDMAYQLETGDRFRVNVFRQRGKMSMAARRIPRKSKASRSLTSPTRWRIFAICTRG
jgi:hypothetical protein